MFFNFALECVEGDKKITLCVVVRKFFSSWRRRKKKFFLVECCLPWRNKWRWFAKLEISLHCLSWFTRNNEDVLTSRGQWGASGIKRLSFHDENRLLTIEIDRRRYGMLAHSILMAWLDGWQFHQLNELISRFGGWLDASINNFFSLSSSRQ